MYGLIAKLTTADGRRDELIQILMDAARGMAGCHSYIVARDAGDENVVWVTEVWDSAASHDASLSLPAVQKAIPRAKAVVSSFEKVAVTEPAGELGSWR
ncbi:MAG TPA: putative quinol monooxygenase [Terriglobales bacterium]|nr:putative quinol monooxygenase [Terriglobales bacterium]